MDVNLFIQYVLTVLLGLDQLVNALFAGYADETISYRAAIANSEGKLWGCWFCNIIQKIIPDHCNLETPSKALKLSRGATWRPPA
jgi:hypothetical protein